MAGLTVPLPLVAKKCRSCARSLVSGRIETQAGLAISHCLWLRGIDHVSVDV